MSRTVSWCILICASALVLTLAASAPNVLSDDGNLFLKNAINQEMLAILGVILAITLASAGQLHLTMNQIEERQGEAFLSKTRANVHRTARWLIGLFCIEVGIVLVKPLIAKADWSQTIVNGFAIVVVLWTVLMLVSLTNLVFAIQPTFEPKPPNHEKP
jgi:hypothetical protein